MKRIKGKYVAQVEIDFNVPVTDDTYSLQKIKNSICGGEMTKAIGYTLSDAIDNVSVTVDQLYADVYEGEEDDT